MSKFDRLLQEYAALSYEELLAFAKRCYGEIATELSAHVRDGHDAPLSVFAACMGADGRLSRPEYDFINDLTDAKRSFEDTLSLIRGMSAEGCRRTTNALADSLPSSKKAALISLCICFVAVDRSISAGETEFIQSLMA